MQEAEFPEAQSTETQPGRSAVVAPGGGYGADGPLLMFARVAVERRGGHAQPVSWSLPGRASFSEMRRQVVRRVAAAVDELTAAAGPAPLIIGKSMGSLAAPLAAERGLPAVWFTPLLTEARTVAALRQATVPCLLVGGTADKFWDGALARSVSPHVLEIEGAAHNLFLPGPLAESAAALGRVASAVEDFLDQVVWP